MENKDIKGIFSTTETQKIGTGTTARKVTKQVLYYVQREADGKLTKQPLNANYIPSGPIKALSSEKLAKEFAPELDLYLKKTLPALRQLTKTIAKAERLRKNGEPYSAELEFLNALKLDDNNARANLGLGLTYLERGEKEKADGVFRKLVTLEDTYRLDNKHMFNEFGIQLRKNGLIEQALKYFASAYKLTRNDENLLYNMARCYFDLGDDAKAAACLKRAIEVRPAFEEAKKFLMHLVKKAKKAKAKAV